MVNVAHPTLCLPGFEPGVLPTKRRQHRCGPSCSAHCSGCGRPVHRGLTSRPEIVCHPCRRAGKGPKKRLVALCLGCGKTYIAERVGGGRGLQGSCSRSCGQRLRRLRAPRSPRSSRICEICGRLYRATYGPTYGGQRTCSVKCGRALRPKRPRPRKPPSSKVYFPTCRQCGKVFTARNARRTLCSEQCQRLDNIALSVARYHSDPAFRDRVLAQAHARRADKLGLGAKKILLSYLIKRDKGRCQMPICQFRSRKVAPLGSKGPRKPSIDHMIPLNPRRGPKGAHELSNVQLAHYRCNLSKGDRGGGEQLRLVG